MKDGYAKIEYAYGPVYASEKAEETAAADCVVLDNAQEILLAGQMKTTLVDSNTGELISIDKDSQVSLWTDIKFETADGSIYSDPIEMITQNPDRIPNIAEFFDADHFSFGLSGSSLPEFYSLPEASDTPGYYSGNIIPENSITVKRYDNGAADVVFKLKYTPSGDANGDGCFSISDAVVLERLLLGKPAAPFSSWKALDFCHDNRLNVFDLIMLKKRLAAINEKGYTEPDVLNQWGIDFQVIKDGLELRQGPSEDFNVISNIPKKIHLSELGYNKNIHDWLFTEYNGQYGWIKISEDNGSVMNIMYYDIADKPVIYLYPEKETDVHVELELTESELSTTYPKYNNGWDVTAYPDGSLLNNADGSHHKYLFWDSTNVRTRFDFSKGFCVAGQDTETFLKEKLSYMGLTENEMNEFIVYWLPRMEHNPYNLISFQGDAYTNSARLYITPSPDSLLRVFMTYVPLDEAVNIAPQQLESFERKGFTAVEWGGCEIR